MSRWALFVGVVCSGAAFAVAKGGTLYVRVSEARVYAAPSEKSARVAVLKAGDEVVWEGPAGAKPWQRVRAGGISGFLPAAKLAPYRPVVEVMPPGADGGMEPVLQPGGETTEERARRSDAGMRAGSTSSAVEDRSLRVIESLNAAVTAEEIAAHAKRVGVASGFETEASSR